MTFGALAKNVLWRKSIDCLGGEAGSRPIVPVMQWGRKKGQRA